MNLFDLARNARSRTAPVGPRDAAALDRSGGAPACRHAWIGRYSHRLTRARKGGSHTFVVCTGQAGRGREVHVPADRIARMVEALLHLRFPPHRFMVVVGGPVDPDSLFGVFPLMEEVGPGSGSGPREAPPRELLEEIKAALRQAEANAEPVASGSVPGGLRG